jgi:hypothetical protein
MPLSWTLQDRCACQDQNSKIQGIIVGSLLGTALDLDEIPSRPTYIIHASLLDSEARCEVTRMYIIRCMEMFLGTVVPIQDAPDFWEAEPGSSGESRKEQDTVPQSDPEASTGDVPESRFLRFGGHITRLGSAGVAHGSSGASRPGKCWQCSDLLKRGSTQSNSYTIEFIGCRAVIGSWGVQTHCTTSRGIHVVDGTLLGRPA